MLEHIPDDGRAMRELFRVLKPGGWAILQTPVDKNRATSYEDPSIVAPAERERAFGQSDHVRIYGRDYPDRLARAGFSVKIDSYARQLGSAEIQRYSIFAEDDIYFCTKPA